MNIEYWSVGSNTMVPLPMSTNDISTRLIEDWVPSFPVAISSAFMGWPKFLIDGTPIQNLSFLSLRPEIKESERQWKSFLSWMLGIAGTRHVLAKEGYRWIAPVSAFYPNATQGVNLASWHLSFPRSSITTMLPPNPSSRLRPDYLAIRKTSAGFQWAVAEAKGTSKCLTGMNRCPLDWYNQARNIQIVVHGAVINIPRYFVVATRVNPNASHAYTRRLQVRAWNSYEQLPNSELQTVAAADISSAHLFGFFRNLGLYENARALSYAVQTRSDLRLRANNNYDKDFLNQLFLRADSEIRRVFRSEKISHDYQESIILYLDTMMGRISVEISAATMDLTKKLQLSLTEDEATKALIEADSQLDKWDKSQSKTGSVETLVSTGVRVQFPEKTD